MHTVTLKTKTTYFFLLHIILFYALYYFIGIHYNNKILLIPFLICVIYNNVAQNSNNIKK